MKLQRLSLLCIGCLLTILPACDSGGDGDGDGDGGDDPLTEAEIQAVVDDYENELTLVTPNPVPGVQHGLADTLNIYASADIVAEYEKISIDEDMADVDFPMGSILLKEQFNADGDLDSLTVMVKGAENADPDTGWYYGFNSAGGTLSSPASCAGCHSARPGTDFVWGL